MKRALYFLLALTMLLTCVSCSSLAAETETGEVKPQSETNAKTEEKDLADYTIPEGFSVGYARVDCTPQIPLPIYNGTAESAKDALMITCTAVADGEKAALLISLDFKSIQRKVATQAMKTIEKTYGIPEEFIMLGATHTHSAPTIGEDAEGMGLWLNMFYKQLKLCVGEALADLSPATAYSGVSQSKNLNFVRRYYLENGSVKMSPSQDDKPVAHESEADPELRTIRFAREGKKDVLMINYQAHYGLWVEQYSADFVHYLREFGEKEMDVHLAYYSGSSANLDLDSRLKGEPYHSGVDAPKYMWEVAKEAISKEEVIETGKIQAAASLYKAKVQKDSADRVEKAKIVNSFKEGSTEYSKRMAEYGFASKREVRAIITRAGLGETQEVPFSAISFGEIAFAAAPIEQFDQSGKEIRAASPFKMTFTLSLTNGSYGYVPTAFAFPNGSYEVYVCRYVPGTAEEFVAEEVRLLNECYNAAK